MGKHKKIKAVDPFYFGNRKQSQNRKVVNQAPKNTDDQEVPRKLRELMQWKQQGGKLGKSKKTPAQQERTEQLKGKSKKAGASREAFPVRRVDPDEPEDGRAVEKVPDFERKPWESEKRFVERMHMATQVAYEKAKWMLDINPLEEEEKKKKQKEKAKQHVNKKREKLKAKRKEKAEEEEEQKRFTDHVQFGEVVSQPPELTARPRKAAGKNKTGKKTLLLNSLLSPKSKSTSTTSSKKNRKRKDRSAAEQRMLDAERERVVQAYRTAKKAKLSGTAPPPVKKIIIGDL
ncbi:coiled-coil domain-containing protein 137-like isoform X1 [Branchiostoma lanceolatum]|uniref:coiled-coil domain-containing protein 137-like isoform X1 n=2 Tax=Branchiostoma lanceolatum TaxID=7740 RepID=UPI00345277CC